MQRQTWPLFSRVMLHSAALRIVYEALTPNGQHDKESRACFQPDILSHSSVTRYNALEEESTLPCEEIFTEMDFRIFDAQPLLAVRLLQKTERESLGHSCQG